MNTRAIVVAWVGFTVGAAVMGCAPAGTGGESATHRAQVHRDAVDELSRLEVLSATRYQEHFDALRPEERAKEMGMVEGAATAPGRIAVEWSRRGVPRLLSSWRMRIPVAPDTALTQAQRAEAFVDAHSRVFGLGSGLTALQLGSVESEPLGGVVARFSQMFRMLPVFGGGLVVRVGTGGDIEWVAGLIVPESAFVPTIPVLTREMAAVSGGGEAASAMLGWLDQEAFGLPMGPPLLSWRVEAHWEYVFLDATTGSQIARVNRYKTVEHKEVAWWPDPWSCTGTWQLGYDDVCHYDGQWHQCPSGWCASGVCEPPAGTPWPGNTQTLYTSLDRTHDYYAMRFGRDGWTNTGGAEAARGNFPHTYCLFSPIWGHCNAVSTGDYHQTGELFFHEHMECLNVVAHEYAHEVQMAQYDHANPACSQSASVSEGIADAMAEFTEAYWNSGSADWEGGGCDATCPITRRLWAPTGSPSVIPALCDSEVSNCGGPDENRVPPDNFSNYRSDCEAHFNGMIVSRAAYLMGNTSANSHWGLSVTGLGEQKASPVWYSTILSLPSYPTLGQFRSAAMSGCAAHLTGSDYSNCANAIEAVGIWNPDVSMGVEVDGGPTGVYYSAAGHTKWMFYKGVNTSAMYARYLYCLNPFVCSWSTPVQFGANGASAPGSAVALGVAATCYTNTSGGITCYRMNSSGTWIAGPNPSATQVVGQPSLASYNGGLFLAYRKSNGGIYGRYTFNGIWSPEVYSGITSSHPPILVSAEEDPLPGADHHLWMVFRAGTGVGYAQLNGTTWINKGLIGQSDQQNQAISVRRPAAAMFRGRLHVAATDDVNIYYGSCLTPCSTPDSWTRIVKQDGTGMGDMLLESYATRNGYLNLWHRLSNPDPPYPLYQRRKLSE